MENLKEKIEKACEAGDVKVTVQELDGRLVVDRVKEGKRWKPEFPENYFYVDDTGRIMICKWDQHRIDLYRYNTQNCFRTTEEAEVKRDEDLLKARILDRIDELNEGWVPDWEDSKEKYCPYYDYNMKIWVVVWNCKHQQHQFYLKSAQACQTLIDEFGDDLKVFFHN